MKVLFTIYILFCAVFLMAQNSFSALDINFGAGITSSKDISTPNIYRAGINYRFSKIFTLSFDIAKGEASQFLETDNISQGNLNLLYSPFGNNKRHDLKAGMGISILDITYTRPDRILRGPNTQLPITEENLSSFDGEIFTSSNSIISHTFNFVAAYSYSLCDRLIIGLQVQSQPFERHLLNNSIFINAGIRI